MPAKVIRYATESGYRTGLLVKETARKIYLILMDNPVVVKKVARAELAYVEFLTSASLTKAKRSLRAFARSNHQTLSRECRGFI